MAMSSRTRSDIGDLRIHERVREFIANRAAYDGEDDEPTMTIKLMIDRHEDGMATVPETAAVEFVNALPTRCYRCVSTSPMELLAPGAALQAGTLLPSATRSPKLRAHAVAFV